MQRDDHQVLARRQGPAEVAQRRRNPAQGLGATDVIDPGGVDHQGQSVGLENRLQHRQDLVPGQRLRGVNGEGARYRLIDDVGHCQDVAEDGVHHLGHRRLLEVETHRIPGDPFRARGPGRPEHGLVTAHDQWLRFRLGFGSGRHGFIDLDPIGGLAGYRHHYVGVGGGGFGRGTARDHQRKQDGKAGAGRGTGLRGCHGEGIRHWR